MKLLTELSQEEALLILQERKEKMQSVDMQDMADIFYNHRNETLTSEDFEDAFGCSRAAVHARIKYLKAQYGFDIVNVARNGMGAKYKLVGFDGSQKKYKQPKKVKLSIPTPSTFNPLIAQVFA